MMGFCKYLRYAILAAALSVMVAVPSCGLIYDDGYDEEEPVPVSGPADVGFRIELGEPGGVLSRATPDGSYDDGTGTAYENYIDLQGGNWRILFFDAESNTYIDKFVPGDIRPLDDEPYSKRYEVTGTVAASLPSDFRVAVLANWDSYPVDLVAGETTIDDICTGSHAVYSYPVPFTLSADRPVPMYGAKLCEGMVFRSGMMTWLGTIHLLRAMAKVEVAMESTSEVDWTIEKVQMRRYNASGYSAPYMVYGEDDYVKGSYELDYVDNVHVLPGVAMDALADFVRNDDGSFVIYVPEYMNARNGERLQGAASISVTFSERPGYAYTVEFKYYDNAPSTAGIGDYFDIRRNYYYRFRIRKSAEYGEPVVSVDVIPYTSVELAPEFGLTVDDEGNKVDSEGNIVVTGADGLIILRISPDGTITDRSGQLIELDEDGRYIRRDEDGNELWTIEKAGDSRYFIRDANGFLIASVYIKR